LIQYIAKIDKLIKPKMSKLHKSKRRMVKPKESAAPKGEGLGKAAGALGILSNVIGIAGQLKKKPKVQQPKKPVEPVAGRVQKPYLSKKKSTVKKKEVFERQEYPIKSGRFKGLDEAEYKAKIRKLRKMKAERDAALKKPKMSIKKPKLMGAASKLMGGGQQKGIDIGIGSGLGKIAALGGLAYLFFGNKKKSKKK
jgi:hypothetical protein